MQTARSILPELASGRGTARRVVEGQSRYGFGHNPAKDRIHIAENVGSGNAECPDPCCLIRKLAGKRRRIAVERNLVCFLDQHHETKKGPAPPARERCLPASKDKHLPDVNCDRCRGAREI